MRTGVDIIFKACIHLITVQMIILLPLNVQSFQT
jgi:hypothetical protein